MKGEINDKKTLENKVTILISACAECKKIKDNKTNEWKEDNNYDLYYEENRLTHSLCPPCIKRYYPDFYEKNKMYLK